MNQLKSLFIITISLLMLNTLNAQDATSVLKKMDAVLYAPESQEVSIKMIIRDKRGNTKTRKAKTLQKGSDKRLFIFTYPSAYDGIALLSLPDDVMYLYLPAYKKERRIASHAKNGDFQGTDFSYDDLESKTYAEKYHAKSVKESGNTYILTVVPKDGTKSNYSKLVSVLDKTTYYPKKVSFYDKNGKLVKVLTNDKVEKIDGYYTATDFTMKNALKGTETRMIFSDIKFDHDIDDTKFTVRYLKMQ